MPSSVLRSVQFCSVLLFPQFSRAYVIFIPYKIATSRSNNILPSTSHTSLSSSFFLFSLFFPDFSVPKKRIFWHNAKRTHELVTPPWQMFPSASHLRDASDIKGANQRERDRDRETEYQIVLCAHPSISPITSLKIHFVFTQEFFHRITRVLLVENTWIE